MVEIIIKIFEKSIIDDNLLFKTTGLKKTKSGGFRKISGIKAKYFANDNCGYIYPLWKTHKLTPETLKNCNLNDIPTRTVQAAGNTYLCRFTALLNHLLEPISIRYCKFKINEYCRDSKSYLEDLKMWKNSFTSKDCILSTVDIVSLYPSLSVSLVTKALVEALSSCSEYDENTINNIVGICKLALNNNFIVFQDKFYKQKRGIITGDNNSVTIANISLHYVMIRAKKLSSTILIRRYIDDIIFIAKNKTVSDEVITDLKNSFEKFNLKITYTNMSTEDNNLTLPFLDIEHVLTKENNRSFFYTRNFIKPTAINSTFLNGKSFHPLNIFKGIISGEEKRMKRLNERNEDYQESLNKLKNKCIKSNFNLKVIETQFQKIQIKNSITNENITPIENKKNENIYWTSQFKKLLKLTKEENKLFPLGKISFTKPANLGQLFNTSSAIAKHRKAFSGRKCNNCSLCGNHGGYSNMIYEKDSITIHKNKSIKIKPNLNCKSYGIYAAICIRCGENYVGQTKNNFSIRWNQHRHNWKKFKSNFSTGDISDESALFRHYYLKHSDGLIDLGIDGAYKVAFIDQPNVHDLDYKEQFWIDKLNSKINLAKTPYSNLG